MKTAFSKFYNPSKCQRVEKVTVLHKGRVFSKSCIPRKHKCFAIKMYQLCDSTGYTRHETVLGEGQTT
jgi:hypothetical protein